MTDKEVIKDLQSRFEELQRIAKAWGAASGDVAHAARFDQLASEAIQACRAALDCGHCGGTGDVSGEYPGVACPRCNGTGSVCTGTIDGVPELFDCPACAVVPQPQPLTSAPDSYVPCCADQTCPKCVAAKSQPQPKQDSEPVAYRLRDVGASKHYGKDIHVFYETHELKTISPELEPLYTAPQPQPLTVPQGYRLVPVNPTSEMRAVFRADSGSTTHLTYTTLVCGDFDSRYRAMLAAAPQAPAVEPLTHAQKLDIVTNWFTDEADITRAMQMLIDFEQTTPAAHGIGAPKE